MSLIGLGLVMFIKLTALKNDVISYRVGNESHHMMTEETSLSEWETLIP